MDSHTVARSVRDWMSDRLEQYLADLEALVAIDSGTYDKAGVDEVGARLRARYKDLGASIEVFPHATLGDASVSRWRGRGRGRIVLIGHLDTVYALGTAAMRPFRREGGRVFGPGTADMKGGDLLALYAVEALLATGNTDFAELTILNNADEEIGSPASRDLVRREARQADVVLVLEAGRQNGDVVSARKGIANFTVEVDGISAHAGVNHDVGRSAALELAHLIVALESINGTLPDVTVNVGRVEAGDRPNVVPYHGVAEVELRAFDPDVLRGAISRVEMIVERRTVEGTRARLSTVVAHGPMPRTEAGGKLVDLAVSIARSLDFALGEQATGGASDGNSAAAEGTPVLDGLGPVGGNGHSPDEYVDVDSIVPRTALLAGLIVAAPVV